VTPCSRRRLGGWPLVAALAGFLLAVTGCLTQSPPPAAVEYELVVSVSGNGGVRSTPGGIDTANGRAAGTFVAGTSVRLDAVPGEDVVFEGFAFPGDSSASCRRGTVATTCILTLDEPVFVSAAFGAAPVDPDPVDPDPVDPDPVDPDPADPDPVDPDREPLAVRVGGGGGGRVWTVPEGIDTAIGTFVWSFERGSTVTVNASPDTDSTFEGFDLPEGADASCGSGNGSGPTSCTLTLDAATEITATFGRAEPVLADADRFDLVTTGPIAGGQVEIRLPTATAVASVAALGEHVALRKATTGESVRIAWIGAEPSDGPVLRLVLDRVTDPTTIEVTAASAFASTAEDDAGADSFVWRNVGDAAPPSGSLLDDLPRLEATATLSAYFADHRLGDLDANGLLDVRDALRWLELVQGDGWSDFERYHADLDGDDVIDARDLVLLLDRLVDPDLPPRLNVKPTELAFAQLDPAAEGPGVILAANLGNQPFAELALVRVPSGVAASTRGGVVGHALGLELSLPPSSWLGWLPGSATIEDGSGDAAHVRVGHLVVLIGGQSNAVGWGLPLSGWGDVPRGSVRMLGNDYRWKDASEPLDDGSDQLDLVSFDAAPYYSFGTRLGNLLHHATGFPTYLIPTAKGGSRIQEWLPPSNPLDRTRLFGSAAFRGRVSSALSANPVQAQARPSEGGPISVLVWYQGESDSSLSTRRDLFVERTNVVMDRFVDLLDVPVVYVQLASHERELKNRQQHEIGELQRSLETRWGADARQRYHMVATYDLPRSDGVHLSAFAQRVLAERIDLAVREHVLGEPVDGTGPRLVSLSWSGTNVRVGTTHVLAPGAYDATLFTVFDGEPAGSLDDAEYGANTIPIAAVRRDPDDARGVLIELARPPGEGLRPYVRYMGRHGAASTATWGVIRPGAVRAEGGGPGGVGLPLPTFGPLAP
jgi:hypothetical protein